MYLQKIDIQGFKSFAQKTTLEFNQKLTAIVGPNGSGKSNVADAIRWVLGEQSLKLLRGKHAEDVIFAGSDKKTRSGLAEVVMYLNNEDGGAPIDYSEIVITRRVYRDGQSEYLLNNQAVRLIDINLLLAQTNFGQKTYSVIGQGMIDSILLSSPADRKEFFEEATGIKQYQIKREQAINKLLSTYDNLEQAELVLQEITPRLRALTRQVKRLEQREELERELTELQKDYFRWRWHELQQQYLNLSSQHNDINQQVNEANKQEEKLSANLKGLEQAEFLPAAYLQLKRQYEQERDLLNKLLKEQVLASAQDELKHIQKGEGEIAWLKRRLIEVQHELSVEQATLNNLKKSNEQLASHLDKRNQEQVKLITEISRMQKPELAPKDLQQKIAELSQQFDDWFNQLKRAESLSELKTLINQADTISQKIHNLSLNYSGQIKSANLEQILIARDKIINEIATLKATIIQQAEAITNIKLRLEKLTQEQTALNQALTGHTQIASAIELAKQIKESEVKITLLEKQLATFHESAEAKKQQFFSLQNELQQARQQLHSLEQQQHELALLLAKIETKKEDLEREMSQEIPPELAQAVKETGGAKIINEGELALEIQKIKRQLEVTGGIEPEVIAEYQHTKERHDFLNTQKNDLTKAINSLEEVIHDLDQTITKQFVSNFKAINEKFVKYFQLLFDGGKAQLLLQKMEEPKTEEELTEEEAEEAATKKDIRPESQVAKEKFVLQEKLKASMFSGVEIQATPPGKKLSSINALSGGEKALTSIALICSIISHLPSPFVVLDEVDAALDEANSERFASILDNLAQSTQFITITHNRATMKQAAILYGVTMGDDGISRLLSVKLDQAKEIINNQK
ncbi:MAG: chromosome segregation SMC family protein [Patescibacteria group bacterium]